MTAVSPERHRRLMDLFDEVCDLDGEERARRLDALRGEDQALHDELARLLAADAAGGAAIEAGAAALLAMDVTAAHPHRPSVRRASMPQQIGGYRVLRLLGEGGMGVVYEAEQELPQRKVAVKVIRGQLASADLRKRFKLESHILGRLNHPGICRIYEASTDEDSCFLAMELVEGGRPLSSYATERGLATAARLDLLARVCDAVHHAHVKGVIHLDLKPANILVQEDGQPKVLDFGVARIVDPDCALTGMTLNGIGAGTPAYMSPEQTSLSADALDARSDVYTLGAIGYELLSGKLPHDVTNKPVPEIIRQIYEDDPLPLTGWRPDLRGDVETILGKALARDPEMRYQSAAALADDLRRHLRNEPIEARPPTAVYQLVKFAKRNRGLVAALAGLLLALVAGTLFSAIMAARAESARAALAARNDALTVLEARASLREDPTRAAARLKTLSGGAAWDDALAVAHEAEALGVASELLDGHESEVHDAAFMGRTIVTVSYDDTARLWDLPARRTQTIRLAHEVHRVACVPGGACAIAGAGGELDLLDGAGRTRPLAGHKGWVDTLGWSPDGKLLATGGEDGTLRLWHADGTPGAVLDAQHGRVNDLAFSADGARVASAGEDGVVRVFGVDGAALAAYNGHDDEVDEVLFAGAALVSAGRDGRLLRWDPSDGSHRALVESREEIKQLVAAGDTLAWAGREGSVKLLAGGGEPRVVARHDGVVRTLAFSGDGRFLASGGDDRTVRLIDVRSGDAMTLLGHEARVRAVSFAPDGKLLVSVSDDGTARVWPVRAPLCSTARRVAASSGGDLAVAGADRAIRLYDGQGGVRLLAGHGDEIYHLVFSPDGKLLASASRDHTVRVWDVASGASVAVLPCSGRVVRLAFGAGGRLAAGIHTGALSVFTLPGGRELKLAGHDDRVNDLAFTPDGETLISSGEEGTVRAWALSAAGQERLLARLPERATVLALAPDGTRVAAGAGDGSVGVVGIAGGDATILGVHGGEVTGLAWSPDGATLASSGVDRVVRLWRDGRPAGVLTGPAAAISTVAFIRRGTAVLAGAGDGTLRLLAPGHAARILTRGQGPVLDAAVMRDGRVAIANDQDGLRVVTVGGGGDEVDARAFLEGLTRASVDDHGLLAGGW